MTTVMEAVAVAAADVARVKAINTTPDKGDDNLPLYPYGVYSASLGRGDVYTLDNTEGVRWGRIVSQSFGKTAESALAKAEEFRAALVGTALTITGYETTGIRAELDPVVTRDPDTQGVVGVTATYTFTATQES